MVNQIFSKEYGFIETGLILVIGSNYPLQKGAGGLKN